MTRSRTADQGEGRVAPLGVVATTLRSCDVSGPSGCEVPIFTVVLPAPSSTTLDTSARTPMSLERTWTSLDGRPTVPMHATPSLGGGDPARGVQLFEADVGSDHTDSALPLGSPGSSTPAAAAALGHDLDGDTHSSAR